MQNNPNLDLVNIKVYAKSYLIHPFILKILSGNKILTKVKGRNCDNNRWILSLIELDLYFMIINLCIKIWILYINVFKRYRPQTIFLPRSGALTQIIMKRILSIIEFDLYFMIIYLCM